MDGSLPWWCVSGCTLVLLVSSTLNMALRIPSRARYADRFARAGRDEAFGAFLLRRAPYTLATAVIRSLGGLALVPFFFFTGALSTWWQAYLAALGVVLVFGVAVPAAIAKYAGPGLVIRSIPLLEALHWACYPITFILGPFDPLVRRLAGVPKQDAKSYADELEDEIREVVSEGRRFGAVDEEEEEMIESVIEFGDTRVEECMTPRTDIKAIPSNATLEDVLATIKEHGHSRLPVYDETIDSVLGLLYAKDLLYNPTNSAFDVTSIMRRALFIPESKPVRELLREFQADKVHIAVVLDEYGGTAGLVTIEDLLEELVGEIADEYEGETQELLRRIDDHTVEVDARMRIDELNGELEIELPEDGDYETIGGFVFSTLGKIPGVGERCVHENVGIQVIEAEPRRVKRVRLSIEPASNGKSNGKSGGE